jgi:nucleoside-diphosphate-sugar epimerase
VEPFFFVTGGTGFIGSWMLEFLQRANDTAGCKMELIVLSRNPEMARQNAPHIFKRGDTKLIAGDVQTLQNSVGKFDLCIHAATDVNSSLKAVNPLQVFDSVVQGTRRVLDLATTAGASRMLLTSSGAIYGVQPTDLLLMPETYSEAPDLLATNAAYGNSKRAAEWLSLAHSSQSQLQICIARIFAVIGPGLPLNDGFAAGNFVRDAMAGDAIKIQGDGRPLRSYLYMADVIVWLLRILGFGHTGQAYNVGSEWALSISELAGKVVNAAGNHVSVSTSLRGDKAAPPARYVPETRKAREELGLAEYTSIDVALRKTMAWSQATKGL